MLNSTERKNEKKLKKYRPSMAGDATKQLLCNYCFIFS